MGQFGQAKKGSIMSSVLPVGRVTVRSAARTNYRRLLVVAALFFAGALAVALTATAMLFYDEHMSTSSDALALEQFQQLTGKTAEIKEERHFNTDRFVDIATYIFVVDGDEDIVFNCRRHTLSTPLECDYDPSAVVLVGR